MIVHRACGLQIHPAGPRTARRARPRSPPHSSFAHDMRCDYQHCRLLQPIMHNTARDSPNGYEAPTCVYDVLRDDGTAMPLCAGVIPSPTPYVTPARSTPRPRTPSTRRAASAACAHHLPHPQPPRPPFPSPTPPLSPLRAHRGSSAQYAHGRTHSQHHTQRYRRAQHLRLPLAIAHTAFVASAHLTNVSPLPLDARGWARPQHHTQDHRHPQHAGQPSPPRTPRSLPPRALRASSVACPRRARDRRFSSYMPPGTAIPHRRRRLPRFPARAHILQDTLALTARHRRLRTPW
ncbi:hypothetical protein FB451DRAFT_1387092 [Mycena latifolia]|nr:hypothetical protein FB451DRAFT_1387092 [Mycena latifolia]